MNVDRNSVDFVIMACRRDAHYARALLSSIRFFHPGHAVRVLTDGTLRPDAFRAFPDVTVCDGGAIGRDHGLDLPGFLGKLAAFETDGPPHAVFLDADSLLVGPLLDRLVDTPESDFVILDGRELDLSVDANVALFRRYAFDPEVLRETIDPSFENRRILYFSSGQFLFRRGALRLSDVAPLRPHTSSTHAGKALFYGDQGMLNYLVNRRLTDARLNVGIASCTLYGKVDPRLHPDLTADAVLRGAYRAHSILHYTGPSRRVLLKSHNYGDVLERFARMYYERLPAGTRIADDLPLLTRQVWARARALPARVARRCGLGRLRSSPNAVDG
jgi:hypothetical protein